jgi:hypothetical protein
VVVDPRKTRARTQRSQVHEEREAYDPVIHGVDDTTTIKLKEKPTSTIWATGFDAELAKRPSASQLFKRNMTFGTTLTALE